jgi:hypothetical protein
MNPFLSSQTSYASQPFHASQRSRTTQPGDGGTPSRNEGEASLRILESITSKRIPHAVETVILARRCGLDKGVLKRALYEVMRREGFGFDGTYGLGVGGGGVKKEHDTEEQEREEEEDDCVIVDDPSKSTRRVGKDDERKEGKKVVLGLQDVARLVYARERMCALWSEVLKCGEWDRCFGGSESQSMSGASAAPTQSIQSSTSLSAQGSHTASIQGSQAQCASRGVCPGSVPGRVYEIHHRMIVSSDLYEMYLSDPICGYKALVGEVDWEGEGAFLYARSFVCFVSPSRLRRFLSRKQFYRLRGISHCFFLSPFIGQLIHTV